MDALTFRVVVNKSTVPVGSGNLVETLVREGIDEAQPAGTIAAFASAWPATRSFCAKVRAMTDSLYPDRIVVGAAEARDSGGDARTVPPLVEQSFDAASGRAAARAG